MYNNYKQLKKKNNMVFPAGYLLGGIVLKKLSALTIYNTASAYGWPRVYKRILEQTKLHVKSIDDQKHIQYVVRSAIEKPAEMYIFLKDSKVVDFAEKYINSVNNNNNTNVIKNPPSFLYSFASIFVNAFTPLKFLSALGREAEKGIKKK